MLKGYAWLSLKLGKWLFPQQLFYFHSGLLFGGGLCGVLFVSLFVSYCCCVCLFTFIIVKNPQTISFTHHPDGQEPTECGGRMNLLDFEDQIIF